MLQSTPLPIAVTRISTDDLPERSRIATICEFYGRTILKHDIEPIGPQRFEFQANLYRLPGLGLASTAIGPCRAPRGPQHIDSDDVVLNVTRTGRRTVRQRGREAELGAGEAILTTTADPGVVSVLCASRLFSLRLPRAALRSAVTDFDACLVRPVPRDNPALRLLTAYVDTLLASDIPAVPVLLDRVVAHIQDLVALMLGASNDAFEIAQGRGVRAARRQAIDNEIARNLDNEDLSPGLVATKLGVTPRYVHLLLEETGKSFTQHVLERRLERAAALLRDPRRAHCKIAELAAEVGFGDLSYFNRAFRRRYGATPSDIRNAPSRPG